MRNEEVLISLRANIKPFQDAMKSAIQNIDYATQEMVDFNAQVDNANRKQLKGIATSLQQEIKQTSLIIKDMQKELVIATQTEGNTQWTQKLRNNIMVAQGELNSLNKKMDVLNGKGVKTGNVFTRSMSALGGKLKGIGQSIANVGKQFGRMMSFSLMFGMIGILRNGLSEATKLSKSATGNFSAMANVMAGVLVPVVEWFANAIRKAFVWVAGLIKFLTGFDMIAKGIDATNGKIAQLGKDAKKSANQVKGSLGGLDEITNIDSASGDSGGDASVSTDMSTQLGALGSLNDMMTEMNSLDFSWAEPIKNVLDFIKNNGEVIAIVLGGLALAIGVVNVAMWVLSANPIVLTIAAIILGITALIAIVVLCVKHWDVISETVSKFVDNAVEWIKNFAEKVGEFFTNIWNGIKEWIQNVWDGIVGIFQSIIDWVKENWKSILLFIINPFAGIFNYLYENFEGFRNFVDNIVNAVVGFFKAIPGKVMGFFKTLWTNITTLFGNLGSWFGNVIEDVVNFFKQLPNKVFTFVKSLWDKITGLFKDIGSTIGDAISGAVKGAINKVLSGAVNIINGFINAINLAISVINAIPGVNIKKLSKLSVPSFDVGTNYVPQDMLAMVHKGERIVPEKYNNDDWVGDGTDMTETNNLLETLIQVVSSKNLSIDGSAIGRASVDYILSENRRRGEPII